MQMMTGTTTDIRGRTALITGASHGIGRLMAHELSKLGCNLVLVAPDMQSCQECVNECKNLGGNAVALQCDVSNRDDVKKAFDQAMKQFGHVSILINNAAIGRATPLERITDKDLNEFYKVNLTGPVFTTQYAINCFRMNYQQYKRENKRLPTMWIVNIGSAWSKPRYAFTEGAHLMTAYNMCSGALNELTWSTASFFNDKKFGLMKECPDIDCRCVAICPTVFDSGVAQHLAQGMNLSLQQLAESFSISRKVGDPKLVAALAAEVVSNKRQWNNGDLYEIEGDGAVRNMGQGFWEESLKAQAAHMVGRVAAPAPQA